MAENSTPEQTQIPTSLECIVVTPDNTIYEGEATRIMAPGVYGEIAVLPIHTPLYSELKQGTIYVYHEKGEKEIPIESGIIRARNNKVSIIIGF